MKLIIADDHTLFRDTLVEFTKRKIPDCEIECSEDFDGVLDILQSSPEQDLVLLDLRMPGMRGMSGFKVMKERYPDIKVALMSGLAEPSDVRAAVEQGARGYFPKTVGGKGFVEGIKIIMAGQSYVPVDMKTGIVRPSYYEDHQSELGQRDPQATYVTASDIALTPRELDVLELLVKGLSNKQIAINLNIQEVTVKLHMRGICQKLGVTNRTQAALKAREINLVQ